VSLRLETEERCPRCAALVRPGADWCTLCYADLRADPAPSSSSDTASPSDTASAADTASPLDTASPSDAFSTDATQPGSLVQGWPCQRCGGVVAIEEPACTHCGVGFMEGGDDTDPVVRRLRGGVSNQVKAAIMIGGSAALLIIIFGLAYLLRAIF
jgi:hypothetical protein